jgi:hypothetical protein
MSTVNSKMTAIADEIRTLTNTTEPMGLDAMATNIETANTATTTQESLISQIQTALIGKASGGSGSTEINLQDKTITENGTYSADEGYDGLGNVTVNVESGGSGGLETVTGTITLDAPPSGFYIGYIDAYGIRQNLEVMGAVSVSITKGFIYINSSMAKYSGGIEYVRGSMGIYIYHITDDFSLEIQG